MDGQEVEWFFCVCVCLRRTDGLLCVTLQISNNAVLIYFLVPDTNAETLRRVEAPVESHFLRVACLFLPSEF